MHTRFVVALTTAALCYGGNAAAYLINDTYNGGNGYGYGDIIGSTSLFQIFGADMSLNGSVLTVDIFTNLAGRADEKLFADYTDKAPSKIGGVKMGIGYGDVFLSSAWNPLGPAPYDDDTNVTGTLWQFGFSIDGDRWTTDGGTGTLYRLNGATNDANVLLTGDFLSGATYRTGQEVAVDRAANVTQVGTGTWSVTEGAEGIGKVSYTFDIADTSLWNPSDAMSFGLHWAMSCGNDTLEGETLLLPPPPPNRVAEPMSLGLVALGLAGIGGLRPRRRRST